MNFSRKPFVQDAFAFDHLCFSHGLQVGAMAQAGAIAGFYFRRGQTSKGAQGTPPKTEVIGFNQQFFLEKGPNSQKYIQKYFKSFFHIASWGPRRIGTVPSGIEKAPSGMKWAH